MRAYQLAKLNNKLWWTGTIDVTELPKDCDKYKWVSTSHEARELNGTDIH